MAKKDASKGSEGVDLLEIGPEDGQDLLEFAQIPVDGSIVASVVERCRFERMRSAEKSHKYESSTMTPGDEQDPESFKVRRGKVNGYVDYLAPEDIAWIDSQCAVLPELFACYRRGETG